jgi:hypothetical protein
MRRITISVNENYAESVEDILMNDYQQLETIYADIYSKSQSKVNLFAALVGRKAHAVAVMRPLLAPASKQLPSLSKRYKESHPYSTEGLPQILQASELGPENLTAYINYVNERLAIAKVNVSALMHESSRDDDQCIDVDIDALCKELCFAAHCWVHETHHSTVLYALLANYCFQKCIHTGMGEHRNELHVDLIPKVYTFLGFCTRCMEHLYMIGNDASCKSDIQADFNNEVVAEKRRRVTLDSVSVSNLHHDNSYKKSIIEAIFGWFDSRQTLDEFSNLLSQGYTEYVKAKYGSTREEFSEKAVGDCRDDVCDDHTGSSRDGAGDGDDAGVIEDNKLLAHVLSCNDANSLRMILDVLIAYIEINALRCECFDYTEDNMVGERHTDCGIHPTSREEEKKKLKDSIDFFSVTCLCILQAPPLSARELNHSMVSSALCELMHVACVRHRTVSSASSRDEMLHREETLVRECIVHMCRIHSTHPVPRASMHVESVVGVMDMRRGALVKTLIELSHGTATGTDGQTLVELSHGTGTGTDSPSAFGLLLDALPVEHKQAIQVRLSEAQ